MYYLVEKLYVSLIYIYVIHIYICIFIRKRIICNVQNIMCNICIYDI